MKGNFWRYAGWILLLALLVAYPQLVRDEFFIHLAIVIEIWVVLVLSLNLIVGYTGQVSFCHAAFYGIGAYTTALLTLRAGFSFWSALPLGAVSAGILALLIGLPSFRVRGAYFSIITMAFGELIQIIFHNWRGLTNGPDGLPGIPPPPQIPLPLLSALNFAEKPSFYYLTLAMMLGTLFFLRGLVNSRVGRAFIAIREDEGYARSIGIDPMTYKLLSFVIGAMFAGLAGCLYAHYFLYISPSSFTIFQSFEVLLMVIIGGMGSLLGPIFGAIFLTSMPEYLHLANEYRMLIYGLLLVIVIILTPRGLLGMAESIGDVFLRRRKKEFGG